MKATADTLGIDGVFIDPLWRVEVRLAPIEKDLLRSWWVHRLAFISHAGAASVATVQSYSRLEHSLGLLALVAHFAPNEQNVRVAALLHDIGHLPFSHSLEGIEGLDHHDLCAQRVRDLAAVLTRHEADPETIIDLVDGRQPSILHGATSAMRLDHLESFIRSGRAHGRTNQPPPQTLARLHIRDGAVDTDPDTAAYLADLVVAEARFQTSPINLITTAVMRSLAERLLQSPNNQVTVAQLAAMTDHDFWAVILSDPATRDDAQLLQERPDQWTVAEAGEPIRSPEIPIEVRRLYLDLPLVDGHQQEPIDPTSLGLPATPAQFTVIYIANNRRPARIPDTPVPTVGEIEDLLKILAAYQPTVVGSMPLGLQVSESDLDVACEAADLDEFEANLAAHAATMITCQWRRPSNPPSSVTRVSLSGMTIEVFAQPLPVTEQLAFRHMIIEGRLLRVFGHQLHDEVVRLKLAGMSTEAAFAQTLGLSADDPHGALLELEGLSDDDLQKRVTYRN